MSTIDVGNYYPAVLRGAKSESTSIKVALMKMKMKAEGPTSVPQVCITSQSHSNSSPYLTSFPVW